MSRSGEKPAQLTDPVKVECQDCGARWTIRTTHGQVRCLCGGAALASNHAPRPKGEAPDPSAAKAKCPRCGHREVAEDVDDCSQCGAKLYLERGEKRRRRIARREARGGRV